MKKALVMLLRLLAALIVLGLSHVGPASGGTQELIEKTFILTVLPSKWGLSDYVPHYPTDIRKRVPAEHASLLGAYGVAGRVLLAPLGWSGSGAMGADGTASAVLEPRAGSPVPSGFVKLHEVPACMGCAADAAAEYFPRVRDRWKELSPLTVQPPPLRPLVRKAYLTPHLIAYQAASTPNGLEVNGVAYTSMPENYDRPFMGLEVGLPPSSHALASTILNLYTAKFR